MNRIRRILHPTDFSRASGRALAEARELAKQNKAELLVVHVMETPMPYAATEEYASPTLYAELESTARRQAEATISALLKKIQKARVKAKGLLLKGTPHEQIVQVAKTRRVNLIVMGTHGRTGISKLFMGSVAGRVISTARCPVLTVRGR
ncbi:MAG: universal stress protein [Candidatus Binatia bacterium]